MRIQVRYFAVLREKRGCSEEQLDCTPGTTVGDLYSQLFPPQDGPQIRAGYAVNLVQVPQSTILENGDEVAFLPPMGGG